MIRVNTFWHVLKKTCTSSSYYREILNSPIKFSFKFFFFFFFLYAIIFTAFITIRSLIPISKLIVRLPEFAQALYPQELEITIQNGVASTNVQEPYFISTEKMGRILLQWNQQVLGARAEERHNILVIDTDGSLDDFQLYDTYILLTKTSLSVVKGGNETFQTIPLARIKNLVINRQAITTMFHRFTPYLNRALPFLIGMVLLFSFIFFPLNKLFALILYALIIRIVSRIFSLALTYKQSYQVGLHFIVISTILTALIDLLLPASIPFFEVFIIIGLTIVVAHKLKSPSEAQLK